MSKFHFDSEVRRHSRKIRDPWAKIIEAIIDGICHATAVYAIVSVTHSEPDRHTSAKLDNVNLVRRYTYKIFVSLYINI